MGREADLSALVGDMLAAGESPTGCRKQLDKPFSYGLALLAAEHLRRSRAIQALLSSAMSSALSRYRPG